MQSLILISKDSDKIKLYLDSLTKEEHISVFDTQFLDPESSLGIRDVRELQNTVFLKPLESPKKLIIIKKAETATIDAQNALLKLLEEPPPHLLIVLVTENIDALLPTVRSRCTIVTINESKESTNIKPEELDVILSATTLGAKLKLAQDHGKTKEEALLWLHTLIATTRSSLTEFQTSQSSQKVSAYLKLLASLNKAYVILSSTNTSPRLVLENTLLQGTTEYIRK